MKLKIIETKTINEAIAEFKAAEIEPADIEQAKKEKEEHDKLIDDAMKPAIKVADETAKETASPESKVKIAKKLIKNRKELAFAIKEAREAGKTFRVTRSLQEGYRYELDEWFDDGEDEDNDVNSFFGRQEVNIADYKEFLRSALDVADKYDDSSMIYLSPNTYKIDLPFIGTYGGYIEMNHPVHDNVDVGESLKEDKASDEVLPDVKLDEPMVVEVEEPAPVVDVVKLEQNALESMINDLISQKFNDINSLKSMVLSVPENESAVSVLNSIIDETTVQIGMLQKLLTDLNPETKDKFEAGEEKTKLVLSDEEKEPEPEVVKVPEEEPKE